MVMCKFNSGFTCSLFVLVILQVSHLQLTSQNKSAAPAQMLIIFVSILVDTPAWPEPSARMIDVSGFLGRKNSPACFVSASALESQLLGAERGRELWEQ